MCPAQISVTSVCHSVYPYPQYATHTNNPAHAVHTHFCLTVQTGNCVYVGNLKNRSQIIAVAHMKCTKHISSSFTSHFTFREIINTDKEYVCLLNIFCNYCFFNCFFFVHFCDFFHWSPCFILNLNVCSHTTFYFNKKLCFKGLSGLSVVYFSSFTTCIL